jgi:C-terminal processing protease CtpA/Prc
VAGIGLFFVQREKGLCVVDEVVAGGAADSSGRISVGDVLLSVDGRPVDGVCVAMRFLPLVISLTHTHVSGTLPEDVFLANQKE